MKLCKIRVNGMLTAGWIAAAIVISAIVPSRADLIVSRSHRADVSVSVRASDQRVQGENIKQDSARGSDVSSSSTGASFSAALTATMGRAFAFTEGIATASDNPNILPNLPKDQGRLLVRTYGIGNEGEEGNHLGHFIGVSSTGSTASSTIALTPGLGRTTRFNMAWAFTPGQGVLRGPVLNGGQTTVSAGKVSGLLNQDNFDLRLDVGSSGINHFGFGVASWSLNGDLPGLSADNPLLATGINLRANNFTKYFQTPAVTGYGTDTPLYFNTTEFDQETGAIRTGDAVFTSDLIAFAGIVAPMAAPKSGTFTLQFGESEISLQPGSTFNFLELHPNGVTSFRLLGLGDVISDDPQLFSSYSTGLMFAGDGVASFWYQTTVVPEPNMSWLCIAIAGIFMHKRRSRSSPSRKKATCRRSTATTSVLLSADPRFNKPSSMQC